MKKAIYLWLIIVLLPLSAFSQDWYTDLEDARKVATSDHKAIIMVFQGSDWCAPCIKLSREIWDTEEFRAYASEHYVMLQVDFPRQKKHALPEEQQEKNGILAEKYNQNGIFPLVVVLDENGKVVGETGYLKYSPEEYIEHINSFLN